MEEKFPDSIVDGVVDGGSNENATSQNVIENQNSVAFNDIDSESGSTGVSNEENQESNFNDNNNNNNNNQGAIKDSVNRFEANEVHDSESGSAGNQESNPSENNNEGVIQDSANRFDANEVNDDDNSDKNEALANLEGLINDAFNFNFGPASNPSSSGTPRGFDAINGNDDRIFDGTQISILDPEQDSSQKPVFEGNDFILSVPVELPLPSTTTGQSSASSNDSGLEGSFVTVDQNKNNPPAGTEATPVTGTGSSSLFSESAYNIPIDFPVENTLVPSEMEKSSGEKSGRTIGKFKGKEGNQLDNNGKNDKSGEDQSDQDGKDESTPVSEDESTPVTGLDSINNSSGRENENSVVISITNPTRTVGKTDDDNVSQDNPGNANTGDIKQNKDSNDDIAISSGTNESQAETGDKRNDNRDDNKENKDKGFGFLLIPVDVDDEDKGDDDNIDFRKQLHPGFNSKNIEKDTGEDKQENDDNFGLFLIPTDFDEEDNDDNDDLDFRLQLHPGASSTENPNAGSNEKDNKNSYLLSNPSDFDDNDTGDRNVDSGSENKENVESRKQETVSQKHDSTNLLDAFAKVITDEENDDDQDDDDQTGSGNDINNLDNKFEKEKNNASGANESGSNNAPSEASSSESKENANCLSCHLAKQLTSTIRSDEEEKDEIILPNLGGQYGGHKVIKIEEVEQSEDDKTNDDKVKSQESGVKPDSDSSRGNTKNKVEQSENDNDKVKSQESGVNTNLDSSIGNNRDKVEHSENDKTNDDKIESQESGVVIDPDSSKNNNRNEVSSVNKIPQSTSDQNDSKEGSSVSTSKDSQDNSDSNSNDQDILEGNKDAKEISDKVKSGDSNKDISNEQRQQDSSSSSNNKDKKTNVVGENISNSESTTKLSATSTEKSVETASKETNLREEVTTTTEKVNIVIGTVEELDTTTSSSKARSSTLVFDTTLETSTPQNKARSTTNAPENTQLASSETPSLAISNNIVPTVFSGIMEVIGDSRSNANEEKESNDINPKVLAPAYTVFGEPCIDSCEKRGYDYSWCHKSETTSTGTWFNSDYCTTSSKQTAYGEECVDQCRETGNGYYWCKKSPSLWGYCTPDHLLELTGLWKSLYDSADAASDGDASTIQTSSVKGFTVYGEPCRSKCQIKEGSSYSSCQMLKKTSLDDSQPAKDHCTSSAEVSSKGMACVTRCQKTKAGYYQCQTEEGSLGYCTPRHLLELFKNGNEVIQGRSGDSRILLINTESSLKILANEALSDDDVKIPTNLLNGLEGYQNEFVNVYEVGDDDSEEDNEEDNEGEKDSDDNDTNEPVPAAAYTIHGEACSNECDFHDGKEYTWCTKIEASSIGTWSATDYCTKDHRVTQYGEDCIDECEQRGYSYYWCHKDLTLWGHCTPKHLLDKVKEFNDAKKDEVASAS